MYPSDIDSVTKVIVFTLTLPSSALSCLGSLALIITFFAFRDNFHNLSRRLILFLSIADFLQSIFFLMYGLTNYQNACTFLSMFGIFAALSSFMWTLVIAHFVWKTVSNTTEIQTSYDCICVPLSHVLLACSDGVF
jgi:FlaA1/EpsC-like NDP-sugar epimerase